MRKFGEPRPEPANKKPPKISGKGVYTRTLRHDRHWLAAQVPVYPAFASIDFLLEKIHAHPVLCVFPFAERGCLVFALKTLCKYKKLIRVCEGLYSRPAYPSDLSRHYTRGLRRLPKHVDPVADYKRPNAIGDQGLRKELLHQQLKQALRESEAPLDPSHPAWYDWRKDLKKDLTQNNKLC